MAETSISGIDFTIKGSTERAKTSVDSLVSSLKKLKTSLQGSSTGKLKEDMEDIDGSAKKTTTTLGKLMKSIGRITFYRAIRSAIRFVTDGFKEGLENAYQFSKIVGYDLAATMDNLASKSLKMKNQLGSAFGGLIMTVEPYLVQLISLITKAANKISQIFSILAGKDTYLKAIDTVQEYGEAVGGVGDAAKEALKYLAPFDELNRLPGDTGGSGGGGSSAPNYSEMFEETPITLATKDFWTSLKLSFNDVIMDWHDLTPEQLTEKIFAAVLGIFGLVLGTVVTGSLATGIVIGLVGVALSLLASAFIFDHDGTVSREEVLDLTQYVLNGLTGGILGFMVGGPAGALIGAGIGIGLTLLADALDFKAGDENKVGNWKDKLTVAMTTLAGGILGFMIGGPMGALIGVSIGLGINLILEALKPQAGSTSSQFTEDLKSALETAVGAGIGFAIGGPGGALLGMTITVGLHMVLGGSIATWVEENIYGPLKQAWNNFIANHPKIAEVMGWKPYDMTTWEDVNNPGYVNGSMKLDIQANITDIKDSVPASKKTLGQMLADLTGTKDSIPSNKKTTTGWKATIASATDSIKDKVSKSWKAVFGSKDSKAIDGSKINSVANLTSATPGFASGKDYLDGKYPVLTSVARMNQMKVEFAKGKDFVDGKYPVLTTIARMNQTKIDFPTNGKDFASGKFPILSSIARMTATKNELTGDKLPTLPSKANFTTRNNSLTDEQRTFNSTAKFTNPVKGWEGTPTFDANAAMINPYWKDGTPTLKINAEVNNPGNVMGGYGYAKGGAYYGNAWHDIPQAASGGKFHGTMFWAGENGPEVVGHAGGRTEVLNRSQLAATMYAAVSSALSGVQMRVTGMGAAPMTGAGDESMSEDVLYRAMLRALNDSDAFPDEIDLDGAVVYRKMVQRNRMERARTGINPMLAY